MNALYFGPGACSFVPHFGLEKIKSVTGQYYEPRLMKLHKGETHTPEFLKLNPDGQVPVLMVGDEAINQIVAICEHLDRECPQAHLLPAKGIERSRAMSALAWFNNTVHPTFTHFFMPQKYTADTNAQAAIKTEAVEKYRGCLQRLDTMAAAASAQGHAFLGGAEPGLLDAYAFTFLRWGGFCGINPADFKAITPMVEKAMQFPAMAVVLERERIGLNTYKAS